MNPKPHMTTLSPLPALSLLSALACLATDHLIRAAGDKLIAGGLFGIDLNKTPQRDLAALRERLRTHSLATLLKTQSVRARLVPESAGIVAGCVYLSAVLSAAALCDIPMLAVHAALCSIATMLLTGFVDDVLSLSWGMKIMLSTIATAPLITPSGSFLVLPVFLRDGLFEGLGRRLLPGPHLEYSLGLGFLHPLLSALICVFCTNAINIYAGVNGLESGQCAIISLTVIAYAFRHLAGNRLNMTLLLQLPLLAVCAALYRHNRFPSRVFVGDSFTYFAGMVFAVTALTNHFSKTLMLFFVPQIVNFAVSLPQLCGYVECPPHRIPKWDAERDVLVSSGNWTLLNAVLLLTGPMHERSLVGVLLGLQVVCNAMGLLALEMVGFLY